MANTFQDIMTRMLSRVPDSFDKREGSVIYDALAPAAYELQLAYEEMQRYYDNTFAETADRPSLIKRAKEYDVVPNPATYAIRRGVFVPSSIEIPIGERFNLEELNYVVTEKVTDGEYFLRCETIGTIGNFESGQLLPIGYIAGLQKATLLPEIVIYGEEEEDTEVFRQRFWETLVGDARDGNIAQYKRWSAEYSGIGNVKIFPIWNGANTVKVSILNSENGAASPQLVADYQKYLDPDSKGLGNGVAPIGAVVTVSTATELTVNITGKISLASGYTEIIGVREALIEYFKQNAYKKNGVSYMSLGAAIQNCACVDFLTDFRINGGINDIALQNEQIGVLGDLNLAVIE